MLNGSGQPQWRVTAKHDGQNIMKKTVLVAMSGGVDSSVTALLLMREGYKVVGITMQLLPKNSGIDGPDTCCGLRNIEDAKHVASLLNIPHYVLNMRSHFQESVINNFLKEYKMGRTPNPCIRCNQFLKFGILKKKSEEVGAEYTATGHYARIEYDSASGRYTLKRGIDLSKDQSYFLYVMNHNQLKHTLMPLGYQTKANVREIAKKNGLPVYSKPESQEICFIKGNNYRKYFKETGINPGAPGPIYDKEGNLLSTHTGIMNYTIGQRKGLGISAPTPFYVTKIDRESNSIFVGKREDVYRMELTAGDVSWTSERVEKPVRLYAKIRSLHTAAEAALTPLETGAVHLIFKKPQWAITPGQAAVFYIGDKVIGGGTITYGA